MLRNTHVHDVHIGGIHTESGSKIAWRKKMPARSRHSCRTDRVGKSHFKSHFLTFLTTNGNKMTRNKLEIDHFGEMLCFYFIVIKNKIKNNHDLRSHF